MIWTQLNLLGENKKIKKTKRLENKVENKLENIVEKDLGKEHKKKI
jgi:hypothetical protein